MEGGRTASMGPTTNSNSQSQTHHSRPVRSSSRYFYGNSSSSTPATFCGPVRRWQKKWVHVSSSQPSSNKPRKFFLSNGPKSSSSSDSPIILCKWTPLSRPSSDANGDGDVSNAEKSENYRRKLRYTPITVFEEKKKLTAKGFDDDDDKSDEIEKASAENPVIDGEDFYGLLDINNDFMGAARQGTSDGDLIYTRRSHLNFGHHMENKNKCRQPDLNLGGLWATD